MLGGDSRNVPVISNRSGNEFLDKLVVQAA